MSSKNLVICDPEKSYASRLAAFLNGKRGLAFQVKICSDPEQVRAVQEELTVDFLLISDKYPIEQRKELAAEVTIVLLSEMCSTTDKNENSIFKYQSAEEVFSQIMRILSEKEKEDVLYVPTMKSMGAAKNEANNAAQSAPVEKTVEKAIAEVKETYDFSNVEVEPLFKDMVDFDTFSKSDFRAVKVKECEAVPKSKKLLKFVLDDGSGVDRVILSGIHDYYEPEFLVGKTLLAITNLPPRKMMGIDSCGMIISATHLVEGREGLNVLILDDKIPAGAKLY